MTPDYSTFDKTLDLVVNEIDILDSYYEKATIGYNSLSGYLTRDGSSLAIHLPEIFLQGSFKIGTVIKPISGDGSYDVDIVCNLNGLTKQQISPAALKSFVGKEIVRYAESHSMKKEPHEGSRCWTLEYSDEVNFHIDILPTIDNTDSYRQHLRDRGLSYEQDSKFLAFTDKRNPSYRIVSNDWPTTNPEGYANWFLKVSQFEKRREQVASLHKASIDEIKPYQVKTDLQRFVQLLKRHRDVFFGNDDHRVSSIIITTLVACAYEKSPYRQERAQCFSSIIKMLEDSVQITNGEYRLVNPANIAENFLDDWKTDIRYHTAFSNWIKAVKTDLLLLDSNNEDKSSSSFQVLMKSLGVVSPKVDITVRQIDKLSGIPHRQKPEQKWLMRKTMSVQIRATKRMEKGFSMYKWFESGDLLPKHVQLKFEAVADSIQQYNVHWQITNTGEEAKDANCLRGGFYCGEIEEGKRIRKEETLYQGSHYIECYLEKDDICYAHSEPFHVLISDKGVMVTGW